MVEAPWSDQLCDGVHTFLVGTNTSGKLRVTSPSPHFADEGMYARAEELEESTSTELCLVVGTPHDVAPPADSDVPWVLDICLDFFSTRNPFLDGVDADLAATTRRVYLEPSWRRLESMRTKCHFRKLSRDPSSPSTGCESCDIVLRRCQEIAESKFHVRVEALCDAVSKEHDFDTQIAINALVPFYDDTHSASALLSTFAQQLRRLPNAERIKEIATNVGPMSDLPLHLSSRAEIDAMIDDLKAWILRSSTPPQFITIARSAPEYTPDVDYIQSSVLKMLRSAFSSHNVQVV